jgi:hypothetical protein
MSEAADYDQVDSVEDIEDGSIDAEVKRWIAEIERAEDDKPYKDWVDKSARIVQRYKNREQKGGKDISVAYNILWSNVQTLQPALYSRTPKVVARRRFPDNDPVGRAAAQILESSAHFQIEDFDFDLVMKQCRDDYLLAGQGQAWVRYEPVFDEQRIDLEEDVDIELPEDVEIQEDEDGIYYIHEELISESTVVDYVHWKDFLHNPARVWDEVRWVARRVALTYEEAVEEFGKVFTKDLLEDTSVEDISAEQDTGDAESKPFFKKGIVYEIWDKDSGFRYHLSKLKKDGFLRKDEDPLELRDFFPCPRPLLATTTTDSLIPSPDFSIYQNLAEELEVLTKRIMLLEDVIRFVGAYDASCTTLVNIIDNGSENYLEPVQDWVGFAQSGGFKGVLDVLPTEEMANTLMQLYSARDRLKGDLYEITGMSDIIRGSSNPGDTATAQQIKGQFATLRLTDRQQEVQRFAKDLIGLICEIVAEKFDVENIRQMSGQEFQIDSQNIPFEDAMTLLEDDTLRSYRIEIETDSTIAIDERLEREDRINFLNGVGQFMQQFQGMAQMNPALFEVFGEILMFGIRSFNAGRPLESTFEAALEKAEQERQQQAQQPPPPDPKMKELEFKMQSEQQKQQFEMQKAQQDFQAQMQKIQGELHNDYQKVQGELMIEQQKAQNEANLNLQKMQIMFKEFQADIYKMKTEMGFKAQAMQGDQRIKELQVQAEVLKANREDSGGRPQVVIAPIDNDAKTRVVEVMRDAAGNMAGATVTDVEE